MGDLQQTVGEVMDKAPQLLTYLDTNWDWMVPWGFSVFCCGYLIHQWKRKD